MMIPLPLLMWWALATGTPITIVILPGEMPQYQINKSEVDYSPGCKAVVCKA